jgi:ribosomal protein S18 acetylase RimI-like enzyme
VTLKSQIGISSLSADEAAAHVRELGALLHACVHAGASIGFVLPFSSGEAEKFWTGKVVPRLRSGGLLQLVARKDGAIVGAVQLDYDTPPNQPHRAEVRKLLVHPDHRRQGIARALMAALERRADQLGRSLLTLDTRTGDGAEPFYASLGYRTAGVIPGYCRDPFRDALDPTTVMYKILGSAHGSP